MIVMFINKTILRSSLIICLGSVDNSSSRGLRPAACPRDPGILNNSKPCSTKIKRTGSCGQAAGRRHLKCQHTLVIDKECILTVLTREGESIEIYVV